ncbi:MAG TPA: class II aldolase/adducin family protein [bacterium]|nr:class II aldolase/adducin family protein [bacterium]
MTARTSRRALRRSRPGADSHAETRLRDEVARCTRLLAGLGILDYSGHVSARLSGRAAFLIQPFEQSRAGLQPRDLLVCDFDGTVAAGGSADRRPPAEVYLHAEILRARPDVRAVAHLHHELTTVFTVVNGVTLVPVKNHAARWASGVPVYPDPRHVDSRARGRAAARSLGPHHAMLIRAHGQVVVAESVPAVFADALHFVENAEALYRAALLGRPRPLSAREMADFVREFDRDRHVAKLWRDYTGQRPAAHRARARRPLNP